MKLTFIVPVLALTLVLESCAQSNSNNNTTALSEEKTLLSPQEFASKMDELSDEVLLDVRTPSEYKQGHIENSLNYDYNGRDFHNQVAKLDKTKPIMVYCLSGGRSGAAANKLRNDGFEKVYELDLGMMAWRSADLPEVTKEKLSTGMTLEEYNSTINSDKLVLIDFYAEWCGPCKKMAPYLEEISNDMSDKVEVVRIDVDKNQSLAKELKVKGVPVLILYEGGQLKWEQAGYVDKSVVLEHLK